MAAKAEPGDGKRTVRTRESGKRRTGTPSGGKPRLAVWKFASCDGCQLSLLDCEDELLGVAGAVEIAYFPEASRAVIRGPYDLSLVEGSITAPHDAARIQEVRRTSRVLVTIGACATAGGIQALRNFADAAEFRAAVYPRPEYVETLATSTPVAGHVKVDFELRGCPINKRQLLEVVAAFLARRRPAVPPISVCQECKRRGVACVMVARGVPCLGPITHAGCGAICPAYARGCYGCFGPMESPNAPSLMRWWKDLGASGGDIVRALRTFNAWAEPFRRASEATLGEVASGETAGGAGGTGGNVAGGDATGKNATGRNAAGTAAPGGSAVGGPSEVSHGGA